MIRVQNVELEEVWEAMKAWLKDEMVLSREGGSQADLQKGHADFQVLKMVGHAPNVLKEAQTLHTFLTRHWNLPVAAVGLSAYGDGLTSTTNLNKAILRLLDTMGFETSPEEDVLSLAGLDVSGVGVHRPEVYIKLGQDTNDPYWTLRHPEWGGTRGYNTCLAVWNPLEAILDRKREKRMMGDGGHEVRDEERIGIGGDGGGGGDGGDGGDDGGGGDGEVGGGGGDGEVGVGTGVEAPPHPRKKRKANPTNLAEDPGSILGEHSAEH